MQRRVGMMRPSGSGLLGSTSVGITTTGVTVATHGVICSGAWCSEVGAADLEQKRFQSAAQLAKRGQLIPKSRHDQKLVRRMTKGYKPGPQLSDAARKKIDRFVAMEKEAERAELGLEEGDALVVAEKVKKTQEEMDIIAEKAQDYGMSVPDYEAHMAALKPRIIKMYPGDWFCTICNDLNTRIDLACRKCYTPMGHLTNSSAGCGPGAKLHHFSKDRQRKVVMTKRNSRGWLETRSDWECVGCDAKNSAKLLKCRKCDKRKRTGQVKGDWKCTTCSSDNFAARDDCFKCRTPKATTQHHLFSPTVKQKYQLTSRVTNNRRQRLMVLMGLKEFTAHDEELLAETVVKMKKKGVYSEEAEEALRINMIAVKAAQRSARKERQEQQMLRFALRKQYRFDGVKLVRNKEGGYENADGTQAILRESFKPRRLIDPKTEEPAVPADAPADTHVTPAAAMGEEAKESGWQPPVAILGGGTLPGVLGPLTGAPPKLGGYKGPTPEMIAQGIIPNTHDYGYNPHRKELLIAQIKRIADDAVARTGGLPKPKSAQGADAEGAAPGSEAGNAAAEAEWNAGAPAPKAPTQPQYQQPPQQPASQQQPPQQQQPGGGAPQDQQQQQQQGGFSAGGQHSGGMGQAPPQQRGFGAPPPQQRGFGAPAPHQQQQQQAAAPAQQRGFGAPPPQQRGFGAPPQQQQQQQQQAPPAQQRGFGSPPPQQRGFGAPPQQQQQAPSQQQQQQPQGQPQQRGFGAPPSRGFGQRPGGQ